MDNTLVINMKKKFNNDLKFGIQTNGIKHKHADPMPDIGTRFKMVKEQGIFDYVDKTPESSEVEDFKKLITFRLHYSVFTCCYSCVCTITS